ncbi:hypothetical protein MNB_SM-7-225 [hydrothermal vent metagenome]|uniref:NnrS protein involved in response to NO n=1 Tax=hydrothermal vent metagenome TaxID=652676 RepID=A0A1W1B8Z3_9ZZZZ
MFQGLSLEQAPPYKIPLRFFITGAIYLLLFAALSALFSFGIQSRFEYNSIAITHTLTIGFFAHIMVGAMFQMIPVMLGIAYKNVVRNANIIYALLNGGILLFIGGFLTEITPVMHSGGMLLLFGFLYFAYLSFSTVFESVEKDYLIKNFASSFALLFIATIFGFIALMGHSGFVSSVKFGDIHIALMLFGWVFLLVNAVSFRIIPMFFVAKEFPKILKEGNYIAILGLLFAFVYFRLADNFEALKFVQMLLGVVVASFALMTLWILKKRKRARSDLSINLWYFSMANVIIVVLLFIIDVWSGYDLAFGIAFFALFGGIYALINAMLYKIVPFLTWFHLSSSMVFEAEMSAVIPKKMMELQTYLYYLAYISFGLGFFSRYFVVAGALLFLFSSAMLLKNLITGYRYYQEYIKKKVDFSMPQA